jgi:hypothetical protein
VVGGDAGVPPVFWAKEAVELSRRMSCAGRRRDTTMCLLAAKSAARMFQFGRLAAIDYTLKSLFGILLSD